MKNKFKSLKMAKKKDLKNIRYIKGKSQRKRQIPSKTNISAYKAYLRLLWLISNNV